jgi:hypothetical protein
MIFDEILCLLGIDGFCKRRIGMQELEEGKME